MKIAVIIPFYQRTAGILTKAVDAMFQQDLPAGASLWPIIVDDSSPIPAGLEIAHLDPERRNQITVLHQPNGGPGDARNRALDLVADEGADYVAFLDSDDVWQTNHLKDALASLETGFDFYFCDHSRFDTNLTYAKTIPSLCNLRDPATPGFQLLDSCGPVISADGATIMSAYLTDYLSQTSTVVVRQSHVQHLRFDADLRGAGEDHMFWIKLVADGARVAMSWRVNVHCGHGINIYFGAFDFSKVRSVNRVGYLLLFWHKCTDLAVTKPQQQSIRRMYQRYQRAYSFMFLRAVLVGQRPDMKIFRMLVKRTPFMPVTMPFRFLSVLPHRREESKLW